MAKKKNSDRILLKELFKNFWTNRVKHQAVKLILLLHFFKMLKLLLRSEECLTRKCWPMPLNFRFCVPQLAGVSGGFCK